MSKRPGWIGVDLDGTLAHYDRWRGDDHIGAPIPEMVKRIKAWLADGREVRVFTARVGGPGDVHQQRVLIQDYLEAACGLPRLEVTATKDYSMVELWDDRAVRVVPNTGKSVEEYLIRELIPGEDKMRALLLYTDKPSRVMHGVLNPCRLV